jgi:hypothetical protein
MSFMKSFVINSEALQSLLFYVDVGLLIKEAFFCGSSNGQVQPESIK